MMLQQPALALSMAVIAVLVDQSTLSYAMPPLSLSLHEQTEGVMSHNMEEQSTVSTNSHKMEEYITDTSKYPNIFNRNLNEEEETMMPSTSANSEDEYGDSNADFPRLEKRAMRNQKIDGPGRLIKPMKNNEKPGTFSRLMNWMRRIFKHKRARQNISMTLCTHGPYGCFRKR